MEHQSPIPAILTREESIRFNKDRADLAQVLRVMIDLPVFVADLRGGGYHPGVGAAVKQAVADKQRPEDRFQQFVEAHQAIHGDDDQNTAFALTYDFAAWCAANGLDPRDTLESSVSDMEMSEDFDRICGMVDEPAAAPTP